MGWDEWDMMIEIQIFDDGGQKMRFFHKCSVAVFLEKCGCWSFGITTLHKKFNYLLSLQQVVVEHTIGVLKQRWKTLNNLPLVISNKNSEVRASIWIRVCCMLHNYLL
ncbi:hypothetical protein VP01_6205g1 [Puccinia sorghi]|uniref:DDE Tnp4 domain-containing protein n=1 Tax=Puccinia sorghi TaxID=27349 RepID=A0A0L6UGL4_9BASI|nr:hypothetical protein VP01_6205g1 [Puccinia sorghi]